MSKLSYIVRVISLSILSGGSIGIIFAAITLVKAAVAKGMTAAEAATANVPVFLNFATVALVFALLLLVAELLSFFFDKGGGRAVKVRLGASLLAVLSTVFLFVGIIQPMKPLLPRISADEAAHAQFTQLHERSRIVFSLIILFSFVGLIAPGFEPKSRPSQS